MAKALARAFTGAFVTLALTVPAIGADTDAILSELGYDTAAISGLRADGVV